MDNSIKYLRLSLILLGCLLGFTFLLLLLFFLLRFLSIGLLHIPGFTSFYEYLISIVPYLIFLAAYYYIWRKITNSKQRLFCILSTLFLFIAIATCLCSLVFTNLLFFGVNNQWVYFFDDNTHYFLMAQIVLIFFSAGVLALGDPKEEDWLEKREKREN